MIDFYPLGILIHFHDMEKCDLNAFQKCTYGTAWKKLSVFGIIKSDEK